jgi:hypothetical protein
VINRSEDGSDRHSSYTDIWFDTLLRTVNKKSASHIARIISDYKFDMNVPLLKERAESIRSSQQVVIQMTPQSIENTLMKGEVLQIRSLISEDKAHYKGRKLVEEELGIFSNGSKENPHVIYGALYAHQGENMHVLPAPSDRYGNCLMILKTDEIRDRVIFCFGDSAFANAKERLLNWEDAAIGKLLIESCGPVNPIMSYIEAIIAGGVTLLDIEHIYLQQSGVLRKQWKSQSKRIAGIANENRIPVTIVL